MNHSPLQNLRDRALLKTAAYVNGAWLEQTQRFSVTDPATGLELARVADTDRGHAQQAIAAAGAAWPAWRDKTAKERATLLMRWNALMLEHADDLALLMTAEQGKPLAEARGEVAYAASFLEWFAEEGRRVCGETIATHDPGKRLLVLRQAVGVCAAITPWNFPLAMITRKVAPALAAGCPVIVKPAEQTPLCALALAELAARAGLPPGIFNVLSADGANSIAVGRALCESPVVRHLSFTGSTEVGRILIRQCAPTIKKLSLELGGNAPFIVFDDADIESAVEGALISKFRNAGQTCVCVNRFYVQEGVYETFVTRLAERVRELRLGNGFDPGVQVASLIDDPAVEKVRQHVSDAQSKGGRVLAGGRLRSGRLFEPTVIADASADMLCAHEETFGPVAPIFRFQSEAEAIALANATEFGLASYLYSRDIGRIFRVAEALESGMVGINTGHISTAEAPFGGVKQSGLGREGSRHGIEDYLELKYLCLGGI
ncbi:NAD-dependent succinate-semialdehyde dehydrogenase [Variovorax saccharolyticus]|uniref:NAD-dependent succinate-semialdehyde dehydrogenase n=1 Tax=Variovorax saccharolyticus TaxID=3053516 RepID=UPI00257550A7|nr:NAD-dependent succinate-semialdehyde dehydrogenase [Variovorax sp. J22R187]MDM0021882.1 NAD-dependent succinate-semialdehyde dehydrogenase [Variovorax sp. J22R187]